MKTLERVQNAVRAGLNAFEWKEGATPHKVLWTRGPAKLRYYQAKESTKTPVVFTMPFINRFRLADLEPGSSLIAALMEAGHSVYLIDWGEPRRIDQGLDFEDYVLKVMPKAVESALQEPGFKGSKVHMVGICLGGTLSAMFAAKFPKVCKSLVTLNSPFDFKPMAEFQTWTQRGNFPVEKITEAYGNMPGGLIAMGFDNLAPASSMRKYEKAWNRFEDYNYAEQFCVVESWNRDNVNVPGAIYRRLINDLYRDNKLVKGEFTLRGETLDLKNIVADTLVIGSCYDVICKPDAANALIEKISSKKKEYKELRGGHVVTIVGPKAQKNCYPLVIQWIDS